ncbi:unnamed protein product [Zymoseptoria tritici ST99CH_1E4]|uniref:Protein SYS1 n=1 Tax=Zymoseptoria tritici ST99CH_1E4 TaxID=1276532 RepID=A0A2H1H442_ZYMTR|nr:unnamed protein product [Zymoseptoria tritici ST99CH_1E4]
MARRRRPPRPGALMDLSPVRIATQILLLQLSYYGVAIVLIVFTTFVAGEHPDPTRFFDWRQLRGDVTTGWTLGLCWMLDALITVIPILLLIARSKLVPDFALTIHGLNFIITSLYTREIPNTFAWWLLQICSATVMIGVGIWACQWRELRPMAFGGRSKEQTATNSAGNGHLPGPHDEEAGFEMGSSSRGAGRDGAGSYEMVGVAPKEPA